MISDRNPDGSRTFPDLTEKAVNFWFDQYHKAHPECLAWQRSVVEKWRRQGYVASPGDDRKRWFLAGLDATAMPNMEIQSYASALANQAVLRVNQACPPRGWSDVSGMGMFLYDYIGLIVPRPRRAEAEELLRISMRTIIDGVPIDIDAATADWIDDKTGAPTRPSWDRT